MKKITILFYLILTCVSVSGQVSKTVSVTTAGTLYMLIGSTEVNTITNLTVKGNIDARDIAFMRDNLSLLSILDLSVVKIKTYTGIDGTFGGTSISYPANEMPFCSFYNYQTNTYKTSLTSIVLPTSISSIGGSAFCYCSGLVGTFTIPALVNSIGDYALYGCGQLATISVDQNNTRYSSNNGILYNKNQDSLFMCPLSKAGSLTFPQTLTFIGASAFESCNKITGSLLLPASVKTIGDYAFYYCSGLNGDLTIPASIVTIGNYAFDGCSGLTGTIQLPQSLSYLGSFSFFQCNNLNSFQVSASNPYYSSVDNVLFNKNQDTLYICPGAKSGGYTIPSTVKAIGSYAFYNCTKLTGSLNIPAQVGSIGDYAFYGCSAITAFNVESLNQKYASTDGVLFNNILDTLLFYPGARSGSYAIPNTVKNIKTCAFAYCSGITGSLSIPASVNSIGDYAFYGCTQLSAFEVDVNNLIYSSYDGLLLSHNQDSIYICPLSKSGVYTIPNFVKTIDFCAFDGCTGLTEIIFPGSVTSIQKYAFEFCSGLKKITLPKYIATIGSGAFYLCQNLQEIAIATPIPPVIDYYTFYQVNKSTTQLTIPYGSLLNYQKSAYWNEFVKILEGSFTGLDSQATDKNILKFYIENGNLKIEGLSAGEFVEAFTITGIKIRSIISQGNVLTIPLQKSVLYLVKTNRGTSKIIL